jgi:hypothetical protein
VNEEEFQLLKTGLRAVVDAGNGEIVLFDR